MKIPAPSKTALIALAAGCAAGLTLGWMLWRPTHVKPEPPAPAIRQADGSLVAERSPQAHPAVPHQLPSGAKLERQVHVVVQPSAGGTGPTSGPSPEGRAVPADATPCPPVTVDLSLVRMQDGTRRVVVSSPDGRVEQALDIPVERETRPKELKSAIGLYKRWTPWGTSHGITAERDLAFLRGGVDLGESRVRLHTGEELRGIAVGIRVLIRF